MDIYDLLLQKYKSIKTHHSILVSNEKTGKQEEPHKRELTTKHVGLHLPVHLTYHSLISFSPYQFVI